MSSLFDEYLALYDDAGAAGRMRKCPSSPAQNARRRSPAVLLATLETRRFLRRMLSARLPHLHASVAAEVPEVADPGILPVLRRHPLGALLEVYNVTDG